MRKINKLLINAITVSAIGITAPVLSLTSCGKENEQHFTLADEQRVQIINGNNTFEVVFDCKSTIDTTDEFEMEVLDLVSTNDATVSFEYNKTRSIVDEDGKKLVLEGCLSKSDGTSIDSNSNLKFNLKINFHNPNSNKNWSDTYSDFNITYNTEEANVTLLPGQNKLYTHPGTEIQCIKFQLNGAYVSEDTSTIALETTVIGEPTGGVSGVEVCAPAAGHRVFDVKDDVLSVWIHFTREEHNLINNEELSVSFKMKLVCYENIPGETKPVKAWEKKFNDDELTLIKSSASGFVILDNEKNDNGSGHNAGAKEKTYHLYYSDNLSGQSITVAKFGSTEGELTVADCRIGDEELEDEGGFLYKELTITFGKSGAFEEGDFAKFSLSVTCGGTFYINDINFTYIEKKIVDTGIKKQAYTIYSQNWQMYNTELVDAYDYGTTHHIQYTIIPTTDETKHTKDVSVENRRQNVMVQSGQKTMEWDVTIKNTLLNPLFARDFSEFDVSFTGFGNDNIPMWTQKFEGFKIIKQNTPLTPTTSMDQILEPTDPKGIYKFDLGAAIDSIDVLRIKELTITGGTIGKVFAINDPTLRLTETRNAVIVELPLSLQGGRSVEDNDFVEFDLTIESNEEDYTWEQTIHGRMQVWGGFTLWRGCEVEVTVKGDKQWFLSSGGDEVINPGVVGGNTSKVTVDMSCWKQQTGLDWVETRKCKLCVPHDAEEEGMTNYYYFDESSIEIVVTTDGDKKVLDPTAGDYQVSSGGPIMISSNIVKANSIIEFKVALAQGAKVDKATRFYFSYIR